MSSGVALFPSAFLTLADEWGLIPIVVQDGRWDQLKHALLRPLVVIEGTVSRRDNTLNVVAERAWPLSVPFDDRHRRQDWRQLGEALSRYSEITRLNFECAATIQASEPDTWHRRAFLPTR